MRTWKMEGPPEMVAGMVMKVMTSCSLRPGQPGEETADGLDAVLGIAGDADDGFGYFGNFGGAASGLGGQCCFTHEWSC